MYFHLATLFMLLPLLLAAPTPDMEQREPQSLTDVLGGLLNGLKSPYPTS
jgi:hypothetical protein